jgi:hypothetical protein
MSGPGPVAVWIARRLPLDDDAHREELTGSIADLVAQRPRCERIREAASLVGLWLRLWGRREGLDDARQAMRQGIYLGGVLVALVASASAWNAGRFGSGPGTIVAAVLASLGAALAAGGWRAGAVAAVAGSTIVATLATGTRPALSVFAVLALVSGDRFGARRCGRGLIAGVAGAAVLGGIAVAVPGAVSAGAVAVLGGVAMVLLAVGWFDPRFALAATTCWLGALAALGGSTPATQTAAALVLSSAAVASAVLGWTALRRSFAV